MFNVSKLTRPLYYKYLARLNFEAAQAADRKIGELPGYEIAAPPPVMTLCAHCIELSLKAYLLEHGVDEGVVRQMNHNLTGAWEKCIELGADEGELSRDVLAIISDLLSSGRLRYGEESKLGRVPVHGPLTDLCERCLRLCGAPSLVELQRELTTE